MLKIKDNVDLKELEKYGFIHNKVTIGTIRDTYYTEETNKADEDNEIINEFNILFIVNPRDANCKNEIVGCFNALDDAIDESFKLDLLYDLIKDGLVIKVDD